MATKKQDTKPQIKRVKVDDHIKSAKSKNNPSGNIRKPGRPRKNSAPLHGTGQADLGGNPPLLDTGSPQLPEGATDNQPGDAVVPMHDTTEEAKGFLRAPFDLAAGLTGIPGLALYPTQLDALAPSFKVIYDKRILPHLGENADLIAFSMVMTGIIFEKVSIFQQERAKLEPQQPEVNAVTGITTKINP